MIGQEWSARMTTNLITLSMAAVLASCASGPVKLEDKDQSGRFDGLWIAEVNGPRASQEELPGNWYANCDWEPYEVQFQISDGMMMLTGAEELTPVSADGDFSLTTEYKRAGINSVDLVYRGKLSDDDGDGRFEQIYTGYGATGCSASMNIGRR